MAENEGGGSKGGGTVDKKTAEEIAKTMQDVKDAAASATKSFNEQLQVIKQLRDAMAQMSSNLSDMCEASNTCFSPDKWRQVTKEAEKLEEATTATESSTQKLAKALKGPLVKGALLAISAFEGMGQGFKNMLAMGRSMGGLLAGITKGLFNVGAAIIAIPFKMMKGLFSMAQQGGDNSLMQAIEDIRKEYGSLAGTSASAILSTTYDMKGFSDTGLSTFQVFGSLADRMKYVTELAKGMGPQFAQNAEEFKKNGGALIAYQKGLGLSAEMMGAVSIEAKKLGTNMGTVLNDMTKQSLGMAKAFGVDAKVISRDMGKAMQDVAHFGQLSTKELAVATTYANKMGTSLDKLAGLMDKFSTFEDSAESVSKLNEQYGLNLDASEMMEAQDPTAKFEKIRQAMAATGKDMSKLSFQDQKLIAANTGLEASDVKLMLAHKESGDMHAAMGKQAEKNEKKVLSQADAMHELADAIEKIPQSGQGGGGIFDHIFQGFIKGIQTTPEFIALMRNLNKVLLAATQFGFKLGKMFVNLFPGVKEILGGLTDMFNPSRYTKMFNGILGAFSNFQRGGVNGMDGFMKDLDRIFFQFFMEGKPGFTKVVGGFKKFGTIIIALFSKLGIYIVDQLAAIIPKITAFIPKLFEFIRDPKKAGIKIEANVPAWAKPLLKLFDEIRIKLVPAIIDMFKALWVEVGPSIKKGLQVFFWATLSTAVIKSVITTALGFLFKFVSEAFMHSIGGLSAEAAEKSGPLIKKLSGVFKNIFSSVGEFATSSIGKFLGAATIALAVADAAINVSKSIAKFSNIVEKNGFDPATAKIAAGSVGLINTLTFGLLPEGLQEKLALGIAKIADSFFKAVDKQFGAGVGQNIKKYYSGLFDLFGGLGDLLLSMWNGDSKGVNAALEKIGKGLLDMLTATFINFGNLLIKLGPMILEYFWKLQSWLFDKVGNVFLSFKDIPIFGWYFELIGKGFKELSKLAAKFSEIWADIGKFFKKINLSNIFGGDKDAASSFLDPIIDKVKDWGKLLYKFFIAPFEPIINFVTIWGRRLYDLIVLPWQIAFAAIKLVIEAWYQEVFKPIFGLIKSAANLWYHALVTTWTGIYKAVKFVFDLWYDKLFKPMWAFISKWVKNIYDVVVSYWTMIYKAVKTVLDLWWTIFSGVYEKIWSAATNLLDQFNSWKEKLYAVLTEPHERAVVQIKKVIGFLWESYAALPGKLIGWGIDLMTNLVKPFIEAWNKIKEIIGFEKFANIGKNIVDGFVDPISKIPEKTTEIFNKIPLFVRKIFKTQSPSKVMAEIGENIADGLDNSMKEIPKNAETHFNKTVDAANAMRKNISTGVDASKVGVSNVPGGAQSAASPENVKIAVEIIKMITDLVSAIGNAIGGKPTGDVKSADVNAITAAVPQIMKLVNGISDSAGPLVKKIIDIAMAIPAGGAITAGIQNIKSIFEIVSSIPKMLDVITTMPPVPGASPMNTFVSNMIQLMDILKLLSGDPSNSYGNSSLGLKEIANSLLVMSSKIPKGFVGTTAPLISFFQTLSTTAKSLSDIIGSLPTLSGGSAFEANFGAIIAMFKTMSGENFGGAYSVGQIFTSMGIISKMTSTNAPAVTKSIVNSIVAVQEMVNAVKKLDESLSKLQSLNIGAKLGEVAGISGILGLNGNGKYTIGTKDVVININLSVSMDVNKVEKVILESKQSVIKDRINYALELAEQSLPPTSKDKGRIQEAQIKPSGNIAPRYAPKNS